MASSSSLTEQLATLGFHLPAWPEEPEGGGTTGDWIQRGQAYAEGLRLWRAQLRNAPESTKWVVDQLLRHLHDTGQVGVWDQLVCGAIKPEVQASPGHECWQACTKLVRSSELNPAQILGAALMYATDGRLLMAIEAIESIIENETVGLIGTANAMLSVICEYLEETARRPCHTSPSTWLNEARLLERVTHSLSKCNQRARGGKMTEKEGFEKKNEQELKNQLMRMISRELLGAIRQFHFGQAVIRRVVTEPISASNSAFFEYNGRTFAMNIDQATDYHIRESTAKLERLSAFVPVDSNVIIDCGAHVGLFSALAAIKAKEAKVYMFEPDHEMHGYIEYNMPCDSSYTLYGCAIGNAQKTGKFFKSLDSSQTSSLSRGATALFSKILGFEERNVEINRLSDFLLLVNERVDYLKIDVQGQEMSVVEDLAGSGLLERIDILAIESSFLDYESIRCIEILKESAEFAQALLVNSVYGGGDIILHKKQEDFSEKYPDLHRIF